MIVNIHVHNDSIKGANLWHTTRFFMISRRKATEKKDKPRVCKGKKDETTTRLSPVPLSVDHSV